MSQLRKHSDNRNALIRDGEQIRGRQHADPRALRRVLPGSERPPLAVRALRPAVLRPALRWHASPVMQELGLATPEVDVQDEAQPSTPLEECEVWDSSCPPVASTLELLEWDKLSAQVAGFAGTASAREMLRSTGLPLPQAREGSERGRASVSSPALHVLASLATSKLERDWGLGSRFQNAMAKEERRSIKSAMAIDQRRRQREMFQRHVLGLLSRS